MRKQFFEIQLLVLIIYASANAYSQSTGQIIGRVIDQSTGAPVVNAEIKFSGPLKGTVSDSAGMFMIRAATGSYDVAITHISYESYTAKIKVREHQNIDVTDIQLVPKVVALKEVRILSSYVSDRSTPVAVSTINTAEIEKQAGNKDYPELLNQVPGIYATRQGGGSGDDRLTIRGFQQENIALLLNGVPVSSMENGLVYWSNWMGLTDATEAIQVQRGLGASRVAMNSVGGTVNIITKTTSVTRGSALRYSISDYGNQKFSLQLNSGKMKNGLALSFLGSRTQGPGYVDGTYTNGWAYYFSVSWEKFRNHKLVLTAIGSPEKHGQRNYGSTYESIEKLGIRYNSEWGYYNGKMLNLSENFYHKPQVNLNHYWKINEKILLASSAYLSVGYGGGRYSEAYNYGTSVYYFRKDNQVDFDAVIQQNIANEDSTQLSDGTWVRKYSKNILTHYRANHYWTGILSTLNFQARPSLKIIAGLHVRTFKSHLYEEINDLMGGEYWVEQYAWSLAGIAGREQIKRIGDIINVDNYSLMNYGNMFAQAEFTRGKFNMFLASTVSGTNYRREDPYNYPAGPKSEMVAKIGGDAKAGLSYALDGESNLYFNLGLYSREPLFKFVYVNFGNTVAHNLKNEKIMAAEAGYTYANGNNTLRINGYTTYWKDKSLLSRENIQLADSTLTRALVSGLNALHTGLEIEAAFTVARNLRTGANFSLGNWKWTNDIKASIYNDNKVLIDSMTVYAKGLYVGDAPQTQLGIFASYRLLKHFDLDINWLYYDRLYANFDPVNRSDPHDRRNPYRLPAYSLTNIFIGYDFLIQEVRARAQLSCENLFNIQTPVRGDDGADHSSKTFTGFWSLGRTFNLAIRFSF
ncbi:MAG TPA: TonB-dependent receptor [Bacteroidales bacterium]|nr:TonB-dependent receptor [Bacteroidales bacterium]